MTDKITLELTLDELKLIDKYAVLNDETKSLFEKIKSAYPQPKMKHNNTGTIDDLEYNGLRYFRIDYNDTSYPVWWEQTERHHAKMQIVADKETAECLEFDYNNLIKEKEKELIKQNLKKSLQEFSKGEIEPIEDIIKRVKNNTSVRSIIERWWMDTFTSKNKWDVDTCIDDLADQIEFFMLRNKND